MGFDDYTRYIPRQDQWANRNPKSEAEAMIDKLDAPAALRLAQVAIATEKQIADAHQFHEDVKVLCKMHPAYVDSAHNMKLMKHHWESAFATEIPSLDQIEATYFSLREAGVLTLNKAALAAEDKEFVEARVEQVKAQRKAAEFNEADAYTMPMEELKARAMGFLPE